jgi:hypothetical protein
MQSSVQSGGLSSQPRGMIKSNSVSTLMAATTLSDAMCGSMPPSQYQNWHGSMGPSGVSSGHDMSAASLLLSAEPLSACSLHQGSFSGADREGLQAAQHSARLGGALSSRCGAPESGRPSRRTNSAHDLASSTARERPSGGKGPAGSKGAMRVSNRRSQSRYAKDKLKGEEGERSVAEAPRAAGPASVRANETKTTEEQKLEVRHC